MLSSGASIGLGTAMLGLLLNPIAWFVSLASLLVLPLIWLVVFLLGGMALELAIRLTTRSVWPNGKVERDARKGAAPSP